MNYVVMKCFTFIKLMSSSKKSFLRSHGIIKKLVNYSLAESLRIIIE